jgi:hypothetical protein
MSNTRSTTVRLLDELIQLYDVPRGKEAARQARYLHLAAQQLVRNALGSPTIRLTIPSFYIDPRATWLGDVERRIHSSITPEEYEGEDASPDTISEEVGNAAIKFFQASADVLPSEPFLYASRGGDLVAEFSAPLGTLTTVISPTATTVFASGPKGEGYTARTLMRGSNRLREEVQEAVEGLMHGEVVPSG